LKRAANGFIGQIKGLQYGYFRIFFIVHSSSMEEYIYARELPFHFRRNLWKKLSVRNFGIIKQSVREIFSCGTPSPLQCYPPWILWASIFFQHFLFENERNLINYSKVIRKYSKLFIYPMIPFASQQSILIKGHIESE
jgi:hypothetical protein